MEIPNSDYYRGGHYLTVNPFTFLLMREKLLSHSYELSPLRVRFIREGDTVTYFENNMNSRPTILVAAKDYPHHDVFFILSIEDSLVFTGLSMLFKFHNFSPRKRNDLHSNLQKLEKVERLYKVEFTLSLSKMPPCQIFGNTPQPLLGDIFLLSLISSLYNLPIIDDEDGSIRPDLSFSHFEPSGKISGAILDRVLKETFDREFQKRFPGVTFFRVNSTVYIARKQDDLIRFDDTAANELLAPLALSGHIDSIGPDSGSLPFLSSLKNLTINSEGRVLVL